MDSGFRLGPIRLRRFSLLWFRSSELGGGGARICADCVNGEAENLASCGCFKTSSGMCLGCQLQDKASAF